MAYISFKKIALTITDVVHNIRREKTQQNLGKMSHSNSLEWRTKDSICGLAQSSILANHIQRPHATNNMLHNLEINTITMIF